MKIDILPNHFLKEDGTFDKDSAIKLSGKIAGVCYSKEGFYHLENESEEKTLKRVNMTLNNGHHSVYDHIMISFNMQGIPKILAMVLNNEHQYTTSEKSARYTPVVPSDVITDEEIELYNKWVNIFKTKIKKEYGEVLSDFKINKLAMENARYLITVFMPTEMIYTTSLRQINYIASWMQEYIDSSKTPFEKKLASYMKQFIQNLDDLNILEEGLMKNEKYRNLSLFGKNLDKKEDYFGDVYSTTYKASFAYLAQAHRHRTLDYQMEISEDNEYYIPPIILFDDDLVLKWVEDMKKVGEVTPQGQLITVNEMGKYDDFILKCKERLCTAAQLEIMQQTRQTLLMYQKSLMESGNHLSSDITKYTCGARCTFPDFDCSSDCHFSEGKKLERRI